MDEHERAVTRRVIEALNQDWMLVDDGDELDYFVLVDESRCVMEDLKPPKALVSKMVRDGLIVDSHPMPRVRRHISVADGEGFPEPFVYWYKVTPKGMGFAGREVSPVDPDVE